MDILYVVGPNSWCNHQELRWSLRSLEKYASGIDRVFIVGEVPDFISDEIVKIPYPNNYIGKQKNILDSILYAVKVTDIGMNDGGKFLYSSDDHFCSKHINFTEWPIYRKDYHRSNLRTLLPDESYEKDSGYITLLKNTRKFLESYNLPINNFTLHKNMYLWRDTLEEMDSIFGEILESDVPVEIMCTILNYRYNKEHFDFIDTKDHKLFSLNDLSKINDSSMFSINRLGEDSALYKFMNLVYPNKSKYEK